MNKDDFGAANSSLQRAAKRVETVINVEQVLARKKWERKAIAACEGMEHPEAIPALIEASKDAVIALRKWASKKGLASPDMEIDLSVALKALGMKE